MWKWKMSTCLPSGIAIIQLKVMAWVSLYQGCWGFFNVKLLPAARSWGMAAQFIQQLSRSPPTLPLHQAGIEKGSWALTTAWPSSHLAPYWHEPRGKGRMLLSRRADMMHCLWRFQALCTSLRNLSKLNYSTRAFCPLSQSFLLNSHMHFFKMLASVAVNKYSHSVPVFCRWETMH